MTNPKPAAELVRIVKAFRFRVPNLPREAIQGYPVPVVRNGSVQLAFLFFLQRGQAPKPPTVFAPGWVVFVDAQTGAEPEVEERKVDLEKPLGVHQIDPSLGMDAFLAKQERLLELLDQLLPLAGKTDPPLTDPVRQRIAEYRGLWNLLAHKPLAPYYKELNPRWFALLGIP